MDIRLILFEVGKIIAEETPILHTSHYYHDKRKGCRIKPKPKVIQFKDSTTKIGTAKCFTHDIGCCDCGWQTGWHYGELSTLKVEKRCEACKKPIIEFTNSTKYCGSIKDKTGCVYKIKLFRNRQYMERKRNK